MPGQEAAAQLGQLLEVAGRQVEADLADVAFDDVEVVDQPLGGRCDGPSLAQLAEQRPIVLQQRGGVVVQALHDGDDLQRPTDDHVAVGQRDGVLLESLSAEDLGPDRLGVIPRRAWSAE